MCPGYMMRRFISEIRSRLKIHVTGFFSLTACRQMGMRRQGVNAYYMPLAGDVETFGGAKQFAAGARAYQTDVALVGKLYQTDYAYYCSPLSNFQRGYLDGILNAQSKVYGGYFLDEMLDEALLAELNQSYAKASGGKVSITKEELEFMMACEITGRERYLALALLSKYYRVDLYSGDRDTRLEHVNYKGYADYYGKCRKSLRVAG